MRIAASKKINQSAPPTRQPTMRMQAFEAPTRGWIKNENLAGSKGVGADLLDNWFPTATSIKVRGGSTLYATIGAGTRVGAIMPYILGATKKLFAANTTAIYDISSPASPTISPATSVSGLTNGDWAFVQFTTSGRTYLRLVNGADTPRSMTGHRGPRSRPSPGSQPRRSATSGRSKTACSSRRRTRWIRGICQSIASGV